MTNLDNYSNNGILLPKLFWSNVRKICSSDREKLLKFESEGREFAKVLRLEFKLENIVGFYKPTGKVRKVGDILV